MVHIKKWRWAVHLLLFMIVCLLVQIFLPLQNKLQAEPVQERVITTPPEWLNTYYTQNYGSQYDGFYKKAILIHGIPICSTASVSDSALYKAHDVLEIYLRKIATERPEFIEKMLENHVHVIIIGLNEYNYQHPAWYFWENKTERRGGGSVETTVLEEDLDVPEDDIWRQQFCGLVHEFSHTCLRYGIGDADNDGFSQEYYKRINAAYEAAKETGLYKEESAYDLNNYHEYFCGQAGRWFNGNGTNLRVEDAELYSEREQLKLYDRTIYDICAELFGEYELPAPWHQENAKEDRLDELLSIAKSIDKSRIVTGYDALELILPEAEKLAGNSNAPDEERAQMADRLAAAGSSLVPENGNLAYLAKPYYSFISVWETEEAVNDGYVSKVSNEEGIHFGSYGNNSSLETVEYRFLSSVKINTSELFFWEDGSGIKLPKSYDYDYKNSAGEWVRAANVSEHSVKADTFCTATFSTVTTDDFRVILRKQETNSDGVGLSEWRVSWDESLPENPNTPSDPNVPENPDTPSDPNVPENPDTPSNPDVPENPDTPSNPDVPVEPRPTEDSKQLSDCDIRLEKLNYVYTGKPIKPSVSICNVTGTQLQKGKDYTVSYKKNKNAGTAFVMIKGKGRMKGKMTVSFNILPAPITEENYQISFNSKKILVYTGKECKPKITLRNKENGKKLSSSVYYVSYARNIEHTTETDKAVVTVTGKGNYEGTVMAEFDILQKNMASKSGFQLKLGKPGYGDESVIVENPPVRLKYRGIELTDGKDYETEFAYDTMNNKGYVSIRGVEDSNFTGERKIKFKIKKNSIYNHRKT